MTNELKFTTRDEYIAWRARWREEYRELSGYLRRFRELRKERFLEERLAHVKVVRERYGWGVGYPAWEYTRNALRLCAQQMLEERAASKQRAEEQYQASRASA